MTAPNASLHPYQIWEAVLGQLQLQVSRPVFDTWLAGTRATSLDGRVLIVEAPNPFVIESIEKRMYQTVLKSVRSVSGVDLDVRFYVSQPNEAPINALEMSAVDQSGPAPGINKDYTFANFMVGASNQLAVSAAQAVAEAPGYTYNPLFIYAPPGMGKTHLMHAIAHASHARGSNVCYVTSEHFTNEFIQGIRTKTTEDFRTRYRSVDLLLVDDIQFLQGKEQTLEGFFHTFNDLHTFHKQVVLASEQPPTRLDFLDEKLRSRLESGLTTYLQPPDIDTRLAILDSKIRSMGVQATPDALSRIANMEVTNVRQLEGAFNRAVALATLYNSEITLAIAAEAIDAVAKPPMHGDLPQVSHDDLLAAVADYYGITHDQLRGRRRNQRLVIARQAAIHIMFSNMRMGVTEIGKALGRDHSTISLAIKRLDKTLATDAVLQSDISSIAEMLIK